MLATLRSLISGRATRSPSLLGAARPLAEARFATEATTATDGEGGAPAKSGLSTPATDASVYGKGSSPKSHGGARVTVRSLRKKYNRGERISVVTAYDFPSATHVDRAGADILLVGDSAGMVVHGYDTTLPITVGEMLVHCRAVARGAKRAMLVGDLPFGSYESCPAEAARAAVRFAKEGVMDAVKVEGGGAGRLESIRRIIGCGISVMGHVGLLPQSVSLMGGFRPFGKTAREAEAVFDQALRVQDAGCFSIVIECVPEELARCITCALEIPTIGIGAGPHCSGQVLVYHDLLGIMSHPHHASVTPRFAKHYAEIGTAIDGAIRQYCGEVASGAFPSREHTPYSLGEGERDQLASALRSRGFESAASDLEGER